MVILVAILGFIHKVIARGEIHQVPITNVGQTHLDLLRGCPTVVRVLVPSFKGSLRKFPTYLFHPLSHLWLQWIVCLLPSLCYLMQFFPYLVDHIFVLIGYINSSW